MLDDFLKDDETTSFLDELEESPKSELALESRGFLGMTPFQRFLISIMLGLLASSAALAESSQSWEQILAAAKKERAGGDH